MWKQVKGYNGKYEVDEQGQIRNAQTGAKLKATPSSLGYLRITLQHNGRQTKRYVHRLVAEAFIPNPQNLPEVNHKDEDKANNRLENLEWCTHQYNSTYGKLSDFRYNSRIPVAQKLNGETIAKFKSGIDASRATGTNPNSISRVCRGKQKTAGGYEWAVV